MNTKEKIHYQPNPMQMRNAIPLLKKRIDELKNINFDELDIRNLFSELEPFRMKINNTIRKIYEDGSKELFENTVHSFYPSSSVHVIGREINYSEKLNKYKKGVNKAIIKLETLVEIFEEELGSSSDNTLNVLVAYNNLSLHPAIGKRVSQLYKDGHYSDAVEASVKALNNLVRLESGIEKDGTALMQEAFSPKNPKLKFNTLANQSDIDEQRGFMCLFEGAVAGLRNPRAHGFIEDDPERALEFIAFVSLLAKLLDKTTQ